MGTCMQLTRESFWDLNTGCASPSRSYKVVSLTSKYCKVFTLECGAKWRQVRSPRELVSTRGYNNSSVITVNGIMQFLYEEDYVPLFNLESEEWMVSIKDPTGPGDKLQGTIRPRSMTKLNNVLCMVQHTSTNIWLPWLHPTIDRVMPLTVMRDGRMLLFYMYDRSSTTLTLQVYDPLTQKCTQ